MVMELRKLISANHLFGLIVGKKLTKKISKTSKSHIIEFLRARATTDVIFLFRTFRSYTCSFSEGDFKISLKPWFPRFHFCIGDF